MEMYWYQYQNPKERHAKHGHMITSYESGLKCEWGALYFFFFLMKEKEILDHL